MLFNNFNNIYSFITDNITNKNKIFILLIIIIIIIIYYKCLKKNIIPNKLYYRKSLNKKYSKHKNLYLSPNKNLNLNKFKKSLKKKLDNIKLNNLNKIILKLYYADWCPHCIHFKPHWFNLKNKYSDYIEFEEIDCSINSPNVDYVTGFPTISMYKNNKFISKYDDNRDNLENYILNILNQ
jgi:thiol-disulfide isomerase/thioredoxin